MKLHAALLGSLLILSVSGCSSLQTSSDFQAGRSALLTGKSEVALSYFQSVAEKDPSYYYGTAYRQGVLGFLGRTQYAAGQLPQAQKTLERALALNRNDNSARLFLGLTLARSEDRQRGVNEIETSMKNIHEFLEWITQAHRFSFGQFWDPTRKIRSAIEGDLAMIRSKEIDWPKLIADGEWLGKEIDEESDRARYDEIRDRNRDNDGGGDSQP
jgi:tetratricopeptide (TPR) repeat protein